jgi:hypothetical protein
MQSQRQQPFPGLLAEALTHFGHPEVLGTQLVTTREGGWTIVATVRNGAKVPVKELETLSGNVPIHYELEPLRIPEARPAYPSLGE